MSLCIINSIFIYVFANVDKAKRFYHNFDSRKCLINKPKYSLKPLYIGYLVIGIFTTLFMWYYEALWKAAGWQELSNQSAIIISAGVNAAVTITVIVYSNIQNAKKTNEFIKQFTNLVPAQSTSKAKEKEEKVDWGKYVGYLTVPVMIAFATGLSLAYSEQPVTVISIFLGSISIGLAIAIFAIQQSQGAKISDLSQEIHKATQHIQTTTDEAQNLLNDKKAFYADPIIIWYQNLDHNFEHFQNTYKTNFLEQQDAGKKENTRGNLVRMYTTHLQSWRPNIAPAELVGVFGLEVARKWSHLTNQASLDVSLWDLSSDEGIDEMIEHHKKCFGELTELKNTLLPSASDYIKQRDEELEKKKKNKDRQ